MINYQGKDWNVVVVTPAGREKHLSILKKYIYKEMGKGLVDTWQLWANTGVASDRAYLDSMAQEQNGVEVKDLGFTNYSGYNICRFYKFTNDPDTVYLRFDDDIIFVDTHTIYNLVITRITNPEPFVISANIVNNTLFGWIHQAIGALDTKHGIANYTRMDEVAHRDSNYAENVHTTFMEKPHDAWHFPNWLLNQFNPFSVCCFAFFAGDLLPIDHEDEEIWISSIRPQYLGRPCMVLGDAVVVHYGYHTQRGMLDEKPYIYEFYENLCKELS